MRLNKISRLAQEVYGCPGRSWTFVLRSRPVGSGGFRANCYPKDFLFFSSCTSYSYKFSILFHLTMPGPRGKITSLPMRCGWINPSPRVSISAFSFFPQFYSGLLLDRCFTSKLQGIIKALLFPRIHLIEHI